MKFQKSYQLILIKIKKVEQNNFKFNKLGRKLLAKLLDFKKNILTENSDENRFSIIIIIV
jgi:hypothetical protein